ncbi:MAG: Holliday junction resolvase RuvX [Firmicutes bacterium HGW-Firmicutes-14]|nr:MAG: Holliday junction resolvase RuvX [Firmicutes bacterium HGW-Firmicutes-14]
MRILGLDVGDRTIGVAVSDPLGWTAQGLEVIRRTKPKKDWDRLMEIINQYDVDKVVVGLPKNMDGSIGPQAETVLEFILLLKKKINIPVETWDERLTTVAAEKILIGADISRARRKNVIDKMAAVFILQGYLDRVAKE